MTVRLVRSMRPFVSERWGSETSCRIPSLRHTLCSSGAPSEYQRLIVSDPLKWLTASIMSSADFLLAGYAAIQLVALSRTTRVVVSLTRAALVEFRFMVKTESEVTRSPKVLGSSIFSKSSIFASTAGVFVISTSFLCRRLLWSRQCFL